MSKEEIKHLKEIIKGLRSALRDVKAGRYTVLESKNNKKKPKCDFYIKGKCNSKYRKNKPCNSNKCPWKFGGSFAMAVSDQGNRVNKK